MAGAVWTQRCDEAAFDTATQTCAAPYWSAETTVPTVTMDDAKLLFVACATLWALAWGLKKLRQFAETM